jgi:hypothetical protein
MGRQRVTTVETAYIDRKRETESGKRDTEVEMRKKMKRRIIRQRMDKWKGRKKERII